MPGVTKLTHFPILQNFHSKLEQNCAHSWTALHLVDIINHVERQKHTNELSGRCVFVLRRAAHSTLVLLVSLLFLLLLFFDFLALEWFG